MGAHMTRYTDRPIGQIERRSDVLGGRPVIAGTRVPVSAIKEFAKAGYAVSQIRQEYPSLTADDINAAIKYPRI